MKKEDVQNAQQGTGSAESQSESREQQKNQTVNVSTNQQNNFAYQAGLGRDRMIDIEELGGLGGRDDYAGGNNDGMSNQNTNSDTDR